MACGEPAQAIVYFRAAGPRGDEAYGAACTNSPLDNSRLNDTSAPRA